LIDRPRSKSSLALGVALLATGLAVKVTAIYFLIPIGFLLISDRRSREVFLGPILLVPAALWYLHAWRTIGSATGSFASAENGSIWINSLIPSALFKPATLINFTRYLFVRGFTPLGLVLGVWGLSRVDRLYRIWGLAVVAMLGGLAAKAHHEYYWVALAPVLAVGIGRTLVDLARWRRSVALATLGLLVVFSVVQSVSTWKTPTEWSAWPVARAEIARQIPAGEPIVASEALLFLAGRQGCRLEIGREAQERAASEWGQRIDATEPIALVAFYRDQGNSYFVDLTDPTDVRRTALHQAIRQRYTTWFDESGVLIAHLDRPREPSHASR
jgi:hypothetical protein